ncbi:FAD-binding oxidoreductase [soil metagenome]
MRLHLRLVRATLLSPSVRSLVFEVTGQRPFSYEPGQAIDLFVPTASGMTMKRPYSIASAPGFAGPARFEIAVTHVPDGATSRALHALAEGAELDAEGPRGSFRRWVADRDLPALFVAAGSGLAPLRAMLQPELAREVGPSVGLLFGCRTAEDVLWKNELERWVEERPRFTLAVSLSRPHDTWTGATGHVQRHAAEMVARLRPERVFICGLSAMVEAVERALEDSGVPSKAIHFEEYDV